jgi:hypothetical protein
LFVAKPFYLKKFLDLAYRMLSQNPVITLILVSFVLFLATWLMKITKSGETPNITLSSFPSGEQKVVVPFPANPDECTNKCGELLKVIQKSRMSSDFSRYYAEIGDELVKHNTSGGIFVEIGTAFGGLPLALLERFPLLRVITVDPFSGGYDFSDHISAMFMDHKLKYGADTFPPLWAKALAFEAGSRFGNRYANFNMFSHEGADYFPPHSIDTVFIDGDHTKVGVEKDIYSWRRVVKQGRVLLFNDYSQTYWPGVVEAVNNFADKTQQKVNFLPGTFGNVKLYNLPLVFTEDWGGVWGD